MESRSHPNIVIMISKISVSLCLCAIILCLVPATFGDDDGGMKYTQVVKTLDGPIMGMIRNQGGTDLNVFYGIPYAKPPVDDLRLQRPQPVDKYTDVLKATELPPRCMQPRLSVNYIRREMSEDCLYLNVITPVDALGKGAKYPVMISILHEDHLTGSGNDEIDLKAEFAKRRNVILVFVNSRLNFFGYPKTVEEDGIEANIGLMDENFAIHWVKNNIEFFGGDSKTITIRGQGSGGFNVRGHVLSPYTRGLFKNAIVGDQTFYVWGEDRAIAVETSTNIVLDRIGCSKAKDRLKCIQDVDAMDIISALPNRLEAFSPVYDGNYVPPTGSNVELYERANDVNLLMGFASDYSSIFLARVVPEIYTKTELTYDDASNALSVFVESKQVEKIAEIFIGKPNKPISIRKIQDGLVLFLNNIIPADIYHTALLTANRDNLKKGIYTFEYNHVAQTNEYKLCDVDRELGVCVRDQQSPIFGEPYSSYWSHDNEDRKMSEIMMDVYSSFMRTGKPQLPNGKDWPNWNDLKSKEPIVATVILDPKSGGYVDTKNPQFYLDNFHFVNNSLIPKFYPYDPYPMKKQAKIDRKSSYTDFLYDVFQTLYYVDY